MSIFFEKAYDKVLREKTWGVLQKYDVEGRLLLTVKCLYSFSEICSRVGGVKSYRSLWG